MIAKRWNRMPSPYQWAAVVSVLVLIIGALTVALIALSGERGVGNCVNGVLGDRNPLAQTDARAHEAFAVDLQKVLLAPKDEQAAAYQTFLKQLDVYRRTLQADQKARDAQPLGRC